MYTPTLKSHATITPLCYKGYEKYSLVYANKQREWIGSRWTNWELHTNTGKFLENSGKYFRQLAICLEWNISTKILGTRPMFSNFRVLSWLNGHPLLVAVSFLRCLFLLVLGMPHYFIDKYGFLKRTKLIAFKGLPILPCKILSPYW